MEVRSLRFGFCFGTAALALTFGCDPMTVDEPDAYTRPRRDAAEVSDANIDAFTRRDAGPCMTAADCDDGIFCNGTETCSATVCQPGTPPTCDDSLACTVDTCDVSRDRCANTAVDADRDMHGDITCVSETGEALGDDCDDRDARRAPGNLEVCDVLGVDEDCNLDTRGGVDMDDDGFEDSRCCNPMRAGQTTRNCGQDCIDSNRSINPDGTETCNGLDDDCDGTPDEICICTPGATRGCVQRGVCAAGVQTCTDGLVWSNCSIAPAATDVCDGRDENCDGRVDEGTTVQCWLDVDGDGFADRDRAPENLCPDVAGGCPVNYTDVDPATRGDCCDADPRAFEGQTQYFDTISFCGNYNFDCDAAGAETPRWSGYVNDDMQDPLHEPECLNAFSAAACARESAYQASNPEWLSSSLPRCGEGGNLVNSCTWVYVAPLGRDACFFAPAGQRQPCR